MMPDNRGHPLVLEASAKFGPNSRMVRYLLSDKHAPRTRWQRFWSWYTDAEYVCVGPPPWFWSIPLALLVAFVTLQVVALA